MLGFIGRSVVTSSTGKRVVLGAWEKTLAIVELGAGIPSKTIETTFDAGGERIALSDELDVVLTAAYHVNGLASYSVTSGLELWRRKDIKKTQRVLLSSNGRHAYCGREGASLAVVDIMSGRTIKTVRGVRGLYDSKFEAIQFVDAKNPHLLVEKENHKCAVARTTFAFLDVCFAPGFLLLTEAGGPVRCIESASGTERWRYVPKRGRHVLHLGYHEAKQCFLGVEWPYEKGGAKQLLRWSALDGAVIDSMILGHPTDCCFALQGEVIVLADGRVINTISTPTYLKA